MRTTNWAAARKYLRWMALALTLVCCLLIYMSLSAHSDWLDNAKKLATTKIELDVITDQLLKAKTELDANKGKIDGLVSTIARQDGQIKEIMERDSRITMKLFDLELARDAEAYIKNGVYNQPLGLTNVNDMYLFIFYDQKYEEIYKQRYPSFAQCYNWRSAVEQQWVESKLTRNPKKSFNSELGCPQIVEYQAYRLKDGTINPKKEPYLYPMLCKLGHKQKNYGKTIDAYLLSPEIQVECYYEEYTRKLRDCNGDPGAAIVAYWGKQADPFSTKYWLAFQRSKHLWGVWIDDAKTKTK